MLCYYGARQFFSINNIMPLQCVYPIGGDSADLHVLCSRELQLFLCLWFVLVEYMLATGMY